MTCEGRVAYEGERVMYEGWGNYGDSLCDGTYVLV